MEEIHINKVKKIAILSLVIAMTTGFTRAAKHQSGPDATLRLSTGGFALGIVVNWGSGTLTYRGKNYPVKVSGLSVGRVGVTSTSAIGDVFNLGIFKTSTVITRLVVRGRGA